MKKLLLGFPGQGSQKTMIGYDLAQKFQSARSVFNLAESVLSQPLFREIAWNEKNQSEMNKTMNAQPIILATSIAVLASLKEMHGFEIQPTQVKALIGHSLGEYSCLVAAKSLELSDALLLVKQRGICMQQACLEWNKVPSMAAVLGLTWDQAKEIEYLTPKHLVCEAANENGKEQTVLSGCVEGVQFGIDQAKKRFGIRRALKIERVSCPFHSSVMKKAAELFEPHLKQIKFQRPIVPIVFNVDAQIKWTEQDIHQALLSGIFQPVHWGQCVSTAVQISPKQENILFKEIGASVLKFGLQGVELGKPVRALVEDVEAWNFK